MADTLFENLFSSLSDDKALPINGNAYSTIFQSIEAIDSGTIQQPVIIIGERGSGKTFILKKVFSELVKEYDKFFPVLIEGRQIFSNSDIFTICSEKIGLNNDEHSPRPIIEWQFEHKIRVVILLDNIQYYFRRTEKKEHYALRSLVNSLESPMFIGSSDEVIPQFVDYDAAFFDGLKLCYLKPISENQAVELVPDEISKKVLSFYREMPKTIRSVRMAEIAAAESGSSEQNMNLFLNYYSEYFRAKYDSCLLQEQRILFVLAKSPEGLTLKEIRDLLNQDNAKISPYLGIMIGKGLLVRKSTSPRKTKYLIKDILFRFWLLNISGASLHPDG